MERIPVAKPYFPKEDIEEIVRNVRSIFESGMVMQGEWVARFEEEFAKAVGVRFARAVNSGTSALEAILDYYDPRGKEVLVPVNTFLATANAVVHVGGKPIFVDIDAATLLVDVDKLISSINEKTAGIILVHLDGYIVPRIEELRALCASKKIFLIEDAAHAAGARTSLGAAGGLSDAGAFSMLATKVMTSGGEGGMVTTNDEALAARVTSLRFHGEDSKRGIQDRIGHSWRMTEMQAIVGCTQTRRLAEIVEKRMAVANMYDQGFAGQKNITIFPTRAGDKNGYYKYPLRLADSLDRIAVQKRLDEEFGIKTGTSYWPPCHLQPAYRKEFGYKEGDFPVAEHVLNQTISLPMYCDLTQKQAQRVIESVIKVCTEI